MRIDSARTILEFLPLSRIMKNKAEPKLAKMPIKKTGIIHFMRQSYHYSLVSIGLHSG